MKILIAPDSFKNSLSARQVGEAVRRGILQVQGKWEIRIIPVADGGEGTVEAMIDATGGSYIYKEVADPLMRTVNARFGILGDDPQTAVIEMASASGLELLKPEELDPWNTTTYGTGQLMKAALEAGCRKIIIGLGGSATIDGGMGMARALGFEFFNKSSVIEGKGGGVLSEITEIGNSRAEPRLKNCMVIAACDVTNPLTGFNGASMLYGTQKGAGDKMKLQLDANLKHFAFVIRKQMGVDVEPMPGAGAAGGLAAGLMAFTGAVLKPGFSIISDITRLEDHIQWADLVITGEGKMDFQTQFGKTPAGVASLGKKFNKPVIGIAGTLGEGYSELYKYGFDAIFSVIDKPMPLEEAIITAPVLIERCVANVMRAMLLKLFNTPTHRK